MEGQSAFFYVVPLYFRKIETFSQLLLNTCGLYFSKISCWLRKCLVPHGFMAFKPRYLQFKVYSEQGRREGNYRSDFRWEDGSWSRYEVKIQRSTGTTRPIGAPCFCLTLWSSHIVTLSNIGFGATWCREMVRPDEMMQFSQMLKLPYKINFRSQYEFWPA